MTDKIIHLVSIAAPFREGFANMKRPPSAILYVGGYLKQNGYNVVIHHILKEDIDMIVEKIIADDLVLYVGFSVKTGKQIANSAQMSAKLKAAKSDTIILWGGIHPTLMPRECMSYEFVDYVIMGEGEKSALDFTNYLVGKGKDIKDIPGICYEKDGKFVVNPEREFSKNLDEFRQDWDLVEDVNAYTKTTLSGEKLFYFITSRGCPHSCGFCYNQVFNHRRWRSHSVEFVVKEIAEIQKKTGINCVSFDDDNFFTNRKRGLQILRELNKLGITCQWVEARVDYIEEELIAEMVELGVNAIFMGWESGSRNTLEKIAKGFTPELILEKTRLLSKFKGLTVDASSIIGFPWETKKDYDETISLSVRMFEIKPFMLNFNIGLFVPYPGAPTTVDALARGFKFPTGYEGWDRFDILSGEMSCPWLSGEEIEYYHIVDKYAKLLYVHPRLTFPIKHLSYIVAIMSYVRLKMRMFVFPFEIWLTDMVKKRFFKKMEKT